MNMIAAFGLLVAVSLVIAGLISFYDSYQEAQLIKKGLIDAYSGYDEHQLRDLKQKGYKSIALRRIRKGASEKKLSLKDAKEIYESL